MNFQDPKAAVEDLLTEYSHALNTSDAQQLARFYASDGLFMPDGGRIIKGAEEVRRSAVRFLKENQISISFEVKDIVFSSDFAFVLATSTCTVRQPSIGREVREAANDFFVLQKEQQQWKVFRYMFNR